MLITHEGGQARSLTPYEELRRTCRTCLLGEDLHYESGASVMSRIAELVPRCSTDEILQVIVDTAEKERLRKVPLFLLLELCKLKRENRRIRETVCRVVKRPDQMCSILEMLWSTNPEAPIPNGIKRGLADAFKKFNEYSLSKYKNGTENVSLADVLNLVRPKPDNDAQSGLWRKLMEGRLTTPYTWETELSQSENKLESWTELLKNDALGSLALVRNLRNMLNAGVDADLVVSAIDRSKDEVFPHQLVMALCSVSSQKVQNALILKMRTLSGRLPKLSGTTLVLVDASQSMSRKLTDKSDACRYDITKGMALTLSETCESAVIGKFNAALTLFDPSVRGLDLYWHMGTPAGGTYLGQAVRDALSRCKPDRIVVITDEQSSDTPVFPNGIPTYIMNVASYGLALNVAEHVHTVSGVTNGFLDYIRMVEEQ